MSQWQAVILLLGAGVGTYLLRYLPMRWFELLDRLVAGSVWQTVIVALGPAAIIALLVVSLRGLVSTDQVGQWQADSLRIGLSCLAMILARLKWKNTIAITFVGVGCYGVILAWQIGGFNL